jgi:DNA-binding NtrC family response regulator
MEGIGGVEVLRRVKADHPEVEAVILTGQIGTEVEEEARSCGAFDCLMKPLGVEEVVRTLRKAYENKTKSDKHYSETG